MSLQDLTLLAKLEDFDIYTHTVCQKFQKSERHVLSASIRGNVEELICLVIEAAKTQLEERRKRKPLFRTLELLKRTDIRLEYLKMQVRKAYRLKQTDEKTYETWALRARELGGLLGGWLKKAEPYANGSAEKLLLKEKRLV